MNKKRIILVVENQWAEFKEIAKCLINTNIDTKEKRIYSYNVLMSGTDNDIFSEGDEENIHNKFTVFADKIRVWVNTGYDVKYKKTAFEEIKTMADKADLIIMDYILGGAFGSKTGIDIATELAKNKKYNDLKPVLFLSKTELTDKDRKEKYDEYKTYIIENTLEDPKISIEEKERKIESHTKWIFKGFFGDEILKEDYIQNEVVLKGVEKLIKKNKQELFDEYIDKIVCFIESSSQNKIKAMKEIFLTLKGKPFTDMQFEAIKSLSENYPSENEETELNNVLNKFNLN
jgi:galactitol-specific phosphotransferase system IIB component